METDLDFVDPRAAAAQRAQRVEIDEGQRRDNELNAFNRMRNVYKFNARDGMPDATEAVEESGHVEDEEEHEMEAEPIDAPLPFVAEMLAYVGEHTDKAVASMLFDAVLTLNAHLVPHVLFSVRDYYLRGAGPIRRRQEVLWRFAIQLAAFPWGERSHSLGVAVGIADMVLDHPVNGRDELRFPREALLNSREIWHTARGRIQGPRVMAKANARQVGGRTLGGDHPFPEDELEWRGAAFADSKVDALAPAEVSPEYRTLLERNSNKAAAEAAAKAEAARAAETAAAVEAAKAAAASSASEYAAGKAADAAAGAGATPQKAASEPPKSLPLAPLFAPSAVVSAGSATASDAGSDGAHSDEPLVGAVEDCKGREKEEDEDDEEDENAMAAAFAVAGKRGAARGVGEDDDEDEDEDSKEEEEPTAPLLLPSAEVAEEKYPTDQETPEDAPPPPPPQINVVVDAPEQEAAAEAGVDEHTAAAALAELAQLAAGEEHAAAQLASVSLPTLTAGVPDLAETSGDDSASAAAAAAEATTQDDDTDAADGHRERRRRHRRKHRKHRSGATAAAAEGTADGNGGEDSGGNDDGAHKKHRKKHRKKHHKRHRREETGE